jgi:divalent metal cation (Fe/Co/Zn/Cd) transporter
MSQIMTNKTLSMAANKANDAVVYGFLKLLSAIGCMTGGLLLMIAGLLISLEAYLSKSNFNGVETACLVTAFVLLGIGSHFMDLVDKDRKGNGK